MNKSELVYLHLQKVMINHSNNGVVLKKTAFGMLGWLGIPKKLRLKALKILEEKKLIKNVDRYKIKIIHPEKSEQIDIKLNKLIWEDILE